MKTKLLFFLSAFLTFSVATYPQGTRGGGAPAGGSGAPANTAAGTASTSDIGKYSNFDTLIKQGRPGDFLAGNVTVTGGALPWDAIPLTVNCDGKTVYTSNTDPKGNFVIAPSGNGPSQVANTEAKPKFAAQFVGCAVQATLPGFDSSSLTIANRNMQDSPNIGTIALKREDGSTGGAVSATTESAPKDATKAFEKARQEWLDRKPDKAQHDLEKAVQVYPQFAEAWYQLGKIQEASKPQDAWNSFSKAVSADPKFVPPYQQLAILAGQSGKWQELVGYTSRELELNPRGTAQTWYYNALGNYKLNKPDVAEASANKALSMDPLHTQAPNTEQLLAVLLAGKGDAAGALQHLRNCLTYIPAGPNADIIKQQIAQLEPAVPSK
jgi:Tfp pilus assembly protein PilF